MSNIKVYDVQVLKVYTNYHTLKCYIYASENPPTKNDLGLGEKDEILHIRELHCTLVVKEKRTDGDNQDRR